MSDIFLSYASEDREIAFELVKALEQQGWSVWWDREIRTGARFEREITEAIDSARCVVVLWSSSSVQSDWVATEANEGLDRAILVPVLLENVKPPLVFRRLHTSNLVGWPDNDNPAEFVNLVKSVRELLGDPGQATSGSSTQQSIAVLPFVTMGGESEHFGDGISEDILSGLCKVPDLIVKARSSSFKFRGHNESVQRIGEQLNATYILEGSVRMSGNRVRVSAQLIHARLDYHIWSERYDRELTDIFAVQDEITTAILKALDVHFRASPVIAVGTINERAKEAYLTGKQLVTDPDMDVAATAITSFETALDIEPDYGEALVALAGCLINQAIGDQKTRAQTFSRANSLLDRASATGHRSAEYFSTLGLMRVHQQDNESAKQSYLKAIELDPNDATVYGRYAMLLQQTGDIKGAVAQCQRGLDQDPLAVALNLQMADLLEYSGRFEEVLFFLESAREHNADFIDVYWRLAEFHWRIYGDLDAAVQQAEAGLLLDPENIEGTALLARLLLTSGDESGASALIDRINEKQADNPFSLVAVFWLSIFRAEQNTVLETAERLKVLDSSDALLQLYFRGRDIQTRDPAQFMKELEEIHPSFREELGAVDQNNYPDAIYFAGLLQRLGKTERAGVLLDAVLVFLETLPRMGKHGYGLADVRVHALNNNLPGVLASFEAALDAGWRHHPRLWLDLDPCLANIKSATEFQRLLGRLTGVARGTESSGVTSKEADKQRERILLEAIRTGASDIHIDCSSPEYVLVRYRIDGELVEIDRLPMTLHQPLVDSFKAWAGIPVTGERRPEDGRGILNLGSGKSINFRLTILPTHFGESVTLRILDPASATLGFNALGIGPHDDERLQAALQAPDGLMIFTGPTGSGKTVSFYTSINQLISANLRIISAEDPMEIALPGGILQMGTNHRAGVSMEDLISGALRADPDVFMLGEIRDEMTASLSVKIAQTGHLVLTSMHTNRAHHALLSLQKLGLSIAYLPPTFILSQRLARRLCTECNQPYEPDENEQRMMMWIAENSGMDADLIGSNFRSATGCEQCKQGYKGRLGCYESLVLDKATRRLFFDSPVDPPSEDDLWQAVIADGTISLAFDLLQKVAQGGTSLDEFYRVTGYDSANWDKMATLVEPFGPRLL